MEPESGGGMPNDNQMAQWVEAAIGVVGADAEGRAIAAQVIELPPRVLRRQLEEAIVAQGFSAEQAALVAEASMDADRCSGLAPAVVSALQVDPALATEISDAFSNRRDLMAVDPVTIALGALLLLVLRVKRVRVSKDGVEVDLDPLKSDVVKAALSFVAG
jgi:hypothetical protein